MTGSLRTGQRQLGLQVEEIDIQHEALVALISELARRDSAGASRAELARLLRKLHHDTARHFKDEETYLRETGYARLQTHEIVHRELLVGLRKHSAEFEAGDGRLGNRLLSFLKFWLMSHINGMDRDCRPAMRAAPPESRTIVKRSI